MALAEVHAGRDPRQLFGVPPLSWQMIWREHGTGFVALRNQRKTTKRGRRTRVDNFNGRRAVPSPGYSFGLTVAFRYLIPLGGWQRLEHCFDVFRFADHLVRNEVYQTEKLPGGLDIVS